MPVYEFQCTKCDYKNEWVMTFDEFEAWQKKPSRCPQCQGPLWRLYGPPFVQGETTVKEQS